MGAKLWLVGGVAAVAVLGGCAGSRPGSGSENQGPQGCTGTAPSPVVTAGATMWPEPADLSDALNEIQAAGDAAFRDVFSGVEVVPEAGYAIVYRVPSAEFDALIRRAAGPRCVVIRDARFPRVKLMELQERIFKDREYWRGKGILLVSAGSAHDGSGVTVGTPQAGQARVEFPRHYGSDIPITVVDEAAPSGTW